MPLDVEASEGSSWSSSLSWSDISKSVDDELTVQRVRPGLCRSERRRFGRFGPRVHHYPKKTHFQIGLIEFSMANQNATPTDCVEDHQMHNLELFLNRQPSCPADVGAGSKIAPRFNTIKIPSSSPNLLRPQVSEFKSKFNGSQQLTPLLSIAAIHHITLIFSEIDI